LGLCGLNATPYSSASDAILTISVIPPAIGGVGLDDRDALRLQQLAKSPAREQPLARRDGDDELSCALLQRVGQLGQHRLLDPQRMGRAHGRFELHRQRRAWPAVEIQGEVAPRPERLAHRFAAGDHAADRRQAFNRADRGQRIELDGRVSQRQRVLRPIPELDGVGREADVGVKPDPLPHRTAQQLIHGLIRNLAADVPQRHVHARERGSLDRPAAPVSVAVHPLPEIFRVERARAKDELFQVLDRPLDAVGLGRQRALAPAEEAGLVGLDLDVGPIRKRAPDAEGFEGDDFHGVKSSRCFEEIRRLGFHFPAVL